jgi:hypothetical protein
VNPLAHEVQGVVVRVVGKEDLGAALDSFLFDRYGVGDLEAIQGATDRVVELSERSTMVCPLHERRLLPDACRSCRFLAGEVDPPPS